MPPSRVGEMAPAPNTKDSDPLCHYILDQSHLERCQQLIGDYGHIDLQVIDGEAFALQSGVASKTFVVILKCIDHECMVFAVAIFYKNNHLDKFEIKPTGERMPSS
jgi:hypothetical protein